MLYGKHSKHMFTRPRAILFAIVHFESSSESSAGSRFDLIFIFHSENTLYFFQPPNRRNVNAEGTTNGMVRRYHNTSRPRTGCVVRNTEKKNQITNDNGHYIVNFVLDTPVYFSCQSQRVCVCVRCAFGRARVCSCCD